MRDFIDLDDVCPDELQELLALSEKIMNHSGDFADVCKGKIMASLFFEPSTRTQLSFRTAMLRLGGENIGFSNVKTSSVSKGETLADTIRVISGYADLIVLRHPKEGAARAASLYASCGIVNAGDGGHLHPSQTLADLLTIRSELGSLEGLAVGLCGDLKYGRTVHSLVKTLVRFRGTAFRLISHPRLSLPDALKRLILAGGCTYEEQFSLADGLDGLNVLYMTRLQSERFGRRQEAVANSVLTPQLMKFAPQDMIVLHPLPRVGEISPEVDSDPRAKYFAQTQYGLYTRMALIHTLLNHPCSAAEQPGMGTSFHRKGAKAPVSAGRICANPACATKSETYLSPAAILPESGHPTCWYCEGETVPVPPQDRNIAERDIGSGFHAAPPEPENAVGADGNPPEPQSAGRKDTGVAVLFGSPNQDGHTEKLLRSYMRECLPEGGKDARVFRAYETPVSPCIGCNGCKTSFRCVYHDMDSLVSGIENASLLIIATPIYNSSFPAPLKNVLDRLQPLYHKMKTRPVPRDENDAEIKKTVLLLTGGSGSTRYKKSLIDQTDCIMRTLNAKLTDVRVVTGLDLKP